jgi:hypothetical protein
VKIKYTDSGIGFFCTDDNGHSWIELNKNLKKYPALHDMVLQHELGHNSGKGMDFMHDFKDMFDTKKQIELMKFSFRHPSALLSASPIFINKKGIAMNWFMVTMATIIGGITFWIVH